MTQTPQLDGHFGPPQKIYTSGFTPKPILDKAGHPNFPHVQSREYAEHADQSWACGKTRENSNKNAAPKTKKGKCRTCGQSAQAKNGKSERWLWVTWTNTSKQKTRRLNFHGSVSRDFLGIFRAFLSPKRNDPTETHRFIFTHPAPGQSPKVIYVHVFLDLQSPPPYTGGLEALWAWYLQKPSVPELGVARGLLQERPLQSQHGNVRAKSWQLMSNS